MLEEEEDVCFGNSFEGGEFGGREGRRGGGLLLLLQQGVFRGKAGLDEGFLQEEAARVGEVGGEVGPYYWGEGEGQAGEGRAHGQGREERLLSAGLGREGVGEKPREMRDERKVSQTYSAQLSNTDQ